MLGLINLHMCSSTPFRDAEIRLTRVKILGSLFDIDVSFLSTAVFLLSVPILCIQKSLI